MIGGRRRQVKKQQRTNNVHMYETFVILSAEKICDKHDVNHICGLRSAILPT